jgi:4-diphosphocytidyl-2-C-methyl-D-erythritol kinase
MKISLRAPAKINLSLDVCGKRADGYHLLESVMQTISLCDQIEIAESKEFSLFCDEASLPLDESNLAYKAWAKFKERYQLQANVQIRLQKNIPLAGGMAGGSTDCAAVLRGLDRLFGLNLSRFELRSLAAELGSDVPFCLYGGTALATGVGEVITDLKPCPELYVLALNAGFPVSTPAVYGALRLADCPHPDVAAMRAAIAKGDALAVIAAAGNSLEQPAFELFPLLADFKKRIEDYGIKAMLSGSGGTMLGLTTDKERAEAAQRALGADFGFSGVFSLVSAQDI